MTLTNEQAFDRFDRYGALYMLCTRWHNGRWSRGYRILSRLIGRGYHPGNGLQAGRFETDQQREYYRRYGQLRHSL